MHENVPVRFGRGRLDSLVTKGLAAYLIATQLSLPMINLSVTVAVHTRPFVQPRRDTAHLTRS